MSSLVKKVLIEKAELDRMQQRQLRDYSPDLHALAELQTQMALVLANKKMSPEQKLSLLSNYQGRFNKIKKDTGVLTGVSAAPDATRPAPQNVPLQKDRAIKSDASAKEVPPTESADELDDNDGGDDVPPAEAVRHIGIPPMYENKARKLFTKILDHPNILKRNAAGEMVVNGVVVPNSNFNSLFKSMVSSDSDLNQTGVDSFMDALHQIGVRPDELSGKKVKLMYNPPATRGTSQKRLAALRGRFYEKEGDLTDEDEANNNYPDQRKQTKSKARGAKKGQKGKGLKRTPPGLRPNILYVY
jgi:hypothetical protein